MEHYHDPLAQPPPGKLVGRNFNTTVVLTSAPTNEAELQLYRVLQRASLLAYYDTLLEMGGDDVQQLCEAGEEEFLEIMALVGMASKPLHVRRLQKALQEWMTNPAMFRTPLVGTGGFSPRPPVAPPSPAPSQPPPRKETPPLAPQSPSPTIIEVTPCVSPGPSPGSPLQVTPILVESQVQRLADSALHLVNNLPHLEPKINNVKRKLPKDFEQVMAMSEDDPKRMELIRKYAAIYGRFDCKRKPEKPLTLHEVSVNEAAAQLCRLIPALLTRRDELFPLARQVVRDSGYHYSKGHSKSFYRPPSTNGDQPAHKRPRSECSSDSEETLKRRQERLDQIADELRNLNEKRESLAGKENSTSEVEAIHSRHQQLMQEQNQLVSRGLQPNRLYRRNSNGKLTCVDPERQDTDDTDSPFSYSNTSSPLHEIGDSRDSLSREGDACVQSPQENQNGDSDEDVEKDSKSDSSESVKKEKDAFNNSFYSEKVQVIASSGGNIIAVANPALSMSPAVEARTALISVEEEQKSA